MKLAAIISIASAASSCLAVTWTVSYDPSYDVLSTSMDTVSCSDGSNGLITKYGWETFGAIPHPHHIGGTQDVAAWNSPQCGTCYEVTYKTTSIYVLGIDHTAAGLNIAEQAMNDLTGGQAVALGRVSAAVTQVGVSKCGLTPKRDLRAIKFSA